MRALLITVLSLFALLALSMAALADDASHGMAPGAGPDPLAPLNSMLGNWEGSGTSPFGPYTCKITVTRNGAWVLFVNHIYAGGQEVETPTQIIGTNPDGTFSCYAFDSSGAAKFDGTVTADQGHFAFQDGETHGNYDWTFNADGSIHGTYSIHFAHPAPGWPADFAIDETDRKVS